MNEVKISVVIITKNEEGMLPDCLKSVAWANEIIVVDSESTDGTVEIAKKAGAKVWYIKNFNFSKSRNLGLDKTSGEWVLYIDADERVTPQLEEEVFSVISDQSRVLPHTSYAIPRKNIILGQEFKHGGQWPDYVKRLFLKKNLKGWREELHEEPDFEGSMGHLKNPITHIKHENFSQMVDKTNEWSEIEAKLMFDAGHPPMNVPRFISAILREFWKRMILEMAFLDGPKGIMYAMYQVFSRFVSYAKLYELQIKSK